MDDDSLNNSSDDVPRRRLFEDVSEKDWNNWKWQLKNRACSLKEMKIGTEGYFDESRLAVSVTPYYQSVIGNCEALKKTVLPSKDEFVISEKEYEDPLNEDGMSPVPHVIVHRYPDRCLFLVSKFCSTICRYCTRSRFVGNNKNHLCNKKAVEAGLEYIRNNTKIRDVIVSGGDPLTMSDYAIDWLLSELRAIKHVEIIRIGTKIPAVLPQRITTQLCHILKKYRPLWMSIHFTHPAEITPEVKEACWKLSECGIPLGSQTVLLKDVNDSVEVMSDLCKKLMMCNVRPYYLYSCDPIQGSAHFRVNVSKGIEIIKGMRGFISGYAIPNFVVDAVGGGGKIPIDLGYVKNRTEDEIVMENFEGKEYRWEK